MNSSFRDFESNLRMFSPLDENDIQSILKQYNSNFTTYKIPSGVYLFKDLSEVLSRGFKNELKFRNVQPNHKHDKSDSIIIESDNDTLITTLISGYEIKLLKFDKESFLLLS